VVSIVQEAVTNVLKHAGARAVELSVVFGRRKLRLSVTDDGRGFAAPQDGGAGAARRFGLVGMRERAANVGAALSVRSEPGKGTAIRLDVPYRR
jgi:signal transduction histidine kinase